MREVSEAVVPDDRFWAKVGADSWHPLIAHCADVAAVMGRLLSEDCPLSQKLAAAAELQTLPPELIARLVYLTALHDVGKTSHGFQSKAGRAEVGTCTERGHVAVFLW